MNRNAFHQGFKESIPILCSYIFVGVAYGITMNESGYPWYIALLASATIYSGAYEFVLVSFLAGNASLVTIALTALLMNSRQLFYGLSFVDDFRQMGRRAPYMICSMTDETYAVNCSLPAEMPQRRKIMFHVAVLSYIYWLAGTVAGALIGQILPWNMEGIDFCMTALFVIILIGQLEQSRNPKPALIGSGLAVVCRLIFGERGFMLPALLLASGVLYCMGTKGGTHNEQ